MHGPIVYLLSNRVRLSFIIINMKKPSKSHIDEDYEMCSESEYTRNFRIRHKIIRKWSQQENRSYVQFIKQNR